ncbi:MAG TPA: hypothetical protein VLQ65_13780 [Saliniramus sp.]|nr:hypothetical protein [Saliniramus sp.]
MSMVQAQGAFGFRPQPLVLTLALVVAGFAGAIAVSAFMGGPFAPALLVLALAVPSALLATYLATLRRIRNFAVWSEGAAAVRWLSGPWLCIGTGVVVAVVGALVLGLRLVRFERLDWLLLAMTAPVFWSVWRLTRSRLRRQFQPVYGIGRPLWSAALVAAAVMVVVDVGARLATGVVATPSAGAAALPGSSLLVHFVAGIGSFWAETEGFAMAALAAQGAAGGLLALCLMVIGKGVF